MGREAKLPTPSAVEGAEVVAKLDGVLTDVGVYASINFESGFRRVEVDMSYSTARRLIEALQRGGGDA